MNNPRGTVRARKITGGVVIGANGQAVGEHGTIVNVRRPIDPRLLNELTELRTALQTNARSAEHSAAVGQVASAEIAARASDSSGVARALAALGPAARWVLECARTVGTEVAAAEINHALGM